MLCLSTKTIGKTPSHTLCTSIFISFSFNTPTTTMATTLPSSPPPSSPEETIEHVVLFNINDDQDPTKVNEMVNALNALSTLTSVIYLTSGPILRTRSLPSTLKFTHMLHARYPTREALTHYSLHEQHVSVVNSYVKPICEDNMAIDWPFKLSTLDGPIITPRAGSGMRFTFFRIGDETLKEKLLQEGLKKIEESCVGSFVQISYGENFNINRGKGFSVASLVIFPDLNELDASEDYEDQMRSLIKEYKIEDDDIIAVDYVVPRLSS